MWSQHKSLALFTSIPVSSKKNANKCSFDRFLFFERFFLHMSIIEPLLPFLHFMDFEAKIMSVFSREISVKNVNTRPSRHKCAFFVQVNIKIQNERKSRKNTALSRKKCQSKIQVFIQIVFFKSRNPTYNYPLIFIPKLVLWNQWGIEKQISKRSVYSL